MNTSLGDLRYLVSGWSAVAFAIGVLGWLLGNRKWETRFFRLTEQQWAETIRLLPWIMFVMAAFFAGMESASKAYSGPRPAAREFLALRIHSAALVSLAFGSVFAFGSLRLKGLCNRILSLCIILIHCLALGFTAAGILRGW